ncbi:MAG TPA: MBL fold metallo-hydrolase [Chlamydiales bacterium]|jgi:phosphoribosyl 1,2-cyclic phosphodiesterase
MNFLKFWGTRGSCPVSGPEWSRFGGNTPCLEIVYGKERIIIDAGTGIRPLGAELQKGPVDIFFSHTHLDHLVGLPFFEPLHHQVSSIKLWFPDGTERSPRALLDSLFSSDFFPLHLDQIKAKLTFHSMHIDSPVRIGEIELSFIRAHHPGMTYCFKIKTPHETIGYITDNELQGKEEAFIQFFRGCDLLIHEAQYTDEEYQKKTGWGHSGLSNTVEFVKAVGCKRWIVTHHDPKHTDSMLEAMQAEARRKLGGSCNVAWAVDGLTFPLR